MKLKSTCLALFSLLVFATAQAQVKVGANPGSLTTGAVLDAEGSSGARTVIMNDGRVGVSTSAPHTSADLELGSATKALYLNRVANTAAITAPQPGMVIYDLSANCVRVYQGSPAAWSPCLIGAGGGSSANTAPSAPDGEGTFSGRMCFDIAESNDNTNECGALSGRTPNRANFNQAATYSQKYVFTPSGTGTVSNVRFVYVNTNGQVIQSLTPSAPYSGTLTAGSSASAVAVYNQDLSSDTPNSPPSPGSPGSGLALGLTRSNALTADIYVIYNDGSAPSPSGDRQLKLTATVKDCSCCGAYVASNAWKNFLCHNLGADTSLDPNTPSVGIHGAQIQAGRRGPNTTGDSRVDWLTAANNGTQGFAAAPTATNANAGAVSSWNQTHPSLYSWNTGTDTAPSKGPNDPCPSGYRIPTRLEWKGVVDNNVVSRRGTWNLGITNYGSVLRFGSSDTAPTLTLPAAGHRRSDNGSLEYRGMYGSYATSTIFSGEGGANGIYPMRLYANFIIIDTSTSSTSGPTAGSVGHSVRCIQQ